MSEPCTPFSEYTNEGDYFLYVEQMNGHWPKDYIPTYWVTQTGEMWKIRQMTTEHIRNCIKMIKEKWADNPKAPNLLDEFHRVLMGRGEPLVHPKYHSLD